MWYYEFDPATPNTYTQLDIPSSNPAARINVFNIIDDKLYMVVPNAVEGNFNGLYSLDRAGNLKQEMTIDNKYRPTRFYKLEN